MCSYPGILQKVELTSDKISYLADEISKQKQKAIWFLLTAYSKSKERNALEIKFIIKREAILHLDGTHPDHVVKNENKCLGKQSKSSL